MYGLENMYSSLTDIQFFAMNEIWTQGLLLPIDTSRVKIAFS